MIKCGSCLSCVIQLKNLTGMNQRRWYKTPPVDTNTERLACVTSWRSSFGFAFISDQLYENGWTGLWLLFSRRKLLFVMGHRSLYIHLHDQWLCLVLFHCPRFHSPTQIIFPFVKRTQRSVIFCCTSIKQKLLFICHVCVFFLLSDSN